MYIPLCVPEISGNEWVYIKECLDTNWVSSAGSFVDQFEEQTASYLGSECGIATVNGTSALHISLIVSGVTQDDEVLVPTLTFIAPVNAIRYVGAWPVFIDSEPRYWQIDAEKLRDFLDHECDWIQGELINRSSRRRVKAIMPVHIVGHPCDMEPILEVARKYDLIVIEDATESLGATYDGKKIGNFGDIACLSFNGNKLITTGGGGMIITDRNDWADRARYLTTQAKDDPIEYVHNEIGFNYRLTNIQAALGLAQLERIEEFIRSKRDIAVAYEEGLSRFESITTMPANPRCEPVYWLYTVLLSSQITLESRKSLIARLRDCGIESRPLWHPIHTLPPYSQCQSYRVEVAQNLYRRAVSIPCSVGLAQEDQIRCIEEIGHALHQINH